MTVLVLAVNFCLMLSFQAADAGLSQTTKNYVASLIKQYEEVNGELYNV